MDYKLVGDISRALRESGVYPGPAVFEFLQRRGYSADDMLAQGGWMAVLCGMIPGNFKNVDELIEAIGKEV